MNFEEFLKPTKEEERQVSAAENEVSPDETPGIEPEAKSAETPVNDPLVEEMIIGNQAEEPDDAQQLEVSNAVVEEMAKDLVEQKEIVNNLRKQISEEQSQIAELKLKIDRLQAKIGEQNEALGKVGETLAKNAEGPESTKIALLERETELPDRFEGETRDHVLEALKEARDAAEKDGRLRHAQILESVLCANEPNGTLAKKREELQKLFDANANLVSGPVIEALQNLGISHKNGEEYLLPAEILKRTY